MKRHPFTFFWSIAFALAAFTPFAVQAAGISQLDQWTSTTSPSAAITQNLFGKAFRLTGQGIGCASFDSIGTLTSTGIACAAGGSSYPFPIIGNATSTLTQFLAGLTSYASTTIGSGLAGGGLTVSGSATTSATQFATNISINNVAPTLTNRLTITGATNETAIAVTGITSGTGINMNGLTTPAAGISMTGLTSGIGVNGTISATGKLVRFNTTGVAMTTANGLAVTGSANMTADYTGTGLAFSVDSIRNVAASATRTHSGNIIGVTPVYSTSGAVNAILSLTGTTTVLSRTLSNAATGVSAAINATAPVVEISNKTIATNGLTDSSSLLSLLQMATSSTGTSLFLSNAGSGPLATFSGSGNFGIGTTSPYAKLSLGGNLVIGAATAGGTQGDLFLPKLATAAGAVLAVDPFGKVIATTSSSGGLSFAYPFPSNATTTNLTFTNGLTGALTGNADTATKLFTPRNINGVAFDGSAAITIFAASSTALTDNNTFSGTNVFSTAPKLGTITGLIVGSSGTLSAYAGVSCTNQFLRGLSASGASTCASVANTDIVNATIDLTAKVTGVLPLANGGTNASSFSAINTPIVFDGTRLVSTSTNPFYVDALVATGTVSSSFSSKVGVGSTTPFAKLSVGLSATDNGIPAFAIGSSTKTTLRSTAGGQTSTCESAPATSTSATLNLQNSCNQILWQIGYSATTLTLSGGVGGDTKRIVVCNPATGTAGALTWTGVEWAGGILPTQTTTAGQCDVYSFLVTQASSTVASSIKYFGAASAGFQ